MDNRLLIAQKPILHCLGCGRAGRTLVRLLYEADLVQVGQIVNRSQHSAQEAVDFIGSGTAHSALDLNILVAGAKSREKSSAETSQILLMALPESQIGALVTQLTQTIAPHTFDAAFHLSASESSALLKGVAKQVASCHPALAFANPAQALQQFAGSWCVIEGDPDWAQCLRSWCQHLGANALAVSALDKRLYHAAAMAASNFLLATLGLAERMAQEAGLPAAEAHQLLATLALKNIQAANSKSTAEALTGPVERGDIAALQALSHHVNNSPLNQADQALWHGLLRACLPLVEAQVQSNSGNLHVADGMNKSERFELLLQQLGL